MHTKKKAIPTKRASSQKQNNKLPTAGKERSLLEVQKALESIPANNFHVWQCIGAILKKTFGNEGFEVWNNWSKKSDKYQELAIHSQWDNLVPGDESVESVFIMASGDAYDPMILGSHEEYNRWQLFNRVTQSPPAKTFPQRLLLGYGLPALISEAMETSALMSQPVLHLAAALSLSGVLMAHKIRSSLGLRTNIYIIGIAESGAGKDHARSIAKQILAYMGQSELEIGVPVSSAGLIAGLRNANGKGIIFWDEIGRVLGQITDFKAANHERDIITTLMELFSSAQSFYMSKAYANHDGRSPAKPIEQPALSLYGTTVPKRFYDALSGDDVVDGNLARFLTFRSDHYSEPRTEPKLFDPNSMSTELKKMLERWKAAPTNSNPTGDVDLTIKPTIIHNDRDANKLIIDYRSGMHSLICKLNGDDNRKAVLARAAEHAQKLALISHEGPEVSAQVMKWAIDVSQHCIDTMCDAVKSYVSDNKYEANVKKILTFVRKGDTKKGVMKSEIVRKFRSITSRDIADILNRLVVGQEVWLEKRDSPTNKAEIYRPKPLSGNNS